MAYSRNRERVTLEIGNPSATCGHCRFMTALAGEWSVEDGRLVFRAAADPQPRRGPDLESCGESAERVAEFERITVDGEELTAAQVAALRATAAADSVSDETARIREMALRCARSGSWNHKTASEALEAFAAMLG